MLKLTEQLDIWQSFLVLLYKINKYRTKSIYDNEWGKEKMNKKVCHVNNDIEEARVLDLLSENGIKAYAADNGAGTYLSVHSGFSVYGKEIYVDENNAERAVDILKEIGLYGETECEYDGNEISDKEYYGNNNAEKNENNYEKNDYKKNDYKKEYHGPWYKRRKVIARIVLIWFVAMALCGMFLEFIF